MLDFIEISYKLCSIIKNNYREKRWKMNITKILINHKIQFEASVIPHRYSSSILHKESIFSRYSFSDFFRVIEDHSNKSEKHDLNSKEITMNI